jgi:hypothetical protein
LPSPRSIWIPCCEMMIWPASLRRSSLIMPATFRRQGEIEAHGQNALRENHLRLWTTP